MKTDITLLFGFFKFDGDGLNLSINTFVLRCFGLSFGPGTNDTLWKCVINNLAKLWTLIMLSGLSMVLGSAMYIYRGDMDAIVSSSSLFIEDIGGIIKALLFLARRGALERALRMLGALWREAVVRRGGAPARLLLALAARQGAVVSLFFVGMCVVSTVLGVSTPLLGPSHLECWAARGLPANDSVAPLECPPPAFPAPAYYFWDFYKNPGYSLAYNFQVVSIFMLAVLTSAIDTLYITLMIYIAAFLQILTKDTASLREKISTKQGSEKEQLQTIELTQLSHYQEEKMEANLVDVIEFHQKIIMVTNQVQSVISASVFTQFAVCQAVMCMALYAAAAHSGEDNSESLKYGVYLNTIMIELFLYCWYGDRVTQRAEEFGEAAYGCSWYEGSRTFKERVAFIILRTGRPFALRGGSFYLLSRKTFLHIVQTSYSFFNFLRSAKDKRE